MAAAKGSKVAGGPRVAPVGSRSRRVVQADNSAGWLAGLELGHVVADGGHEVGDHVGAPVEVRGEAVQRPPGSARRW
jgi:hypothetical protein